MAYETQNTEEAPQSTKATRARQGSWGRHIFWVLAISIVLAALALLGTWAVSSPDLKGEGGQVRSQTAAPAFDMPEPTPKVVDAGGEQPYPTK